MSYGLRIRLEHHDFLGKLSQIDISERDYTGDYITRTLEGDSPLQTTWGDTSNPLPTIYGSEAIIKFYAESDFEFLFLFTSDARKYKVTHTYDGALDWSGFIAPENWNEPLIAANYCVEATAVDGLGNLKNEIYPEPPAEESRKTLLEIIATILQQTGLTLPINTCVEWEESAQATGADPLDVHYRKTQPLANLNSYELLEQLLPKCRVFQRLGQWWIIGYNSFQMPTISYHRYAYDGTVLSPATATISVRAADYWIEGEPQLEILPACKQQIAIQDYGYTDNLINNGDFEIFNQESETFKNWTNNGGILPEQHDLDNEGNKYCYLPGKQYPGTLEAFGYGNMTQSISRIMKVSAAASTFKISFKYALMGASYSCPLFMRVRIVGSTQTYYLRRYPYTANTDPLFTWKLQPASPDLGDDRITIASTRKKTNQIFDNIDGVYTNVEGKYYNTFDYVPAWKWDIIPDHFEDFSATVEGLPISGNLEVTLYVAFTNRVQIAGACYHSVKLELLNEETQHYPLQRSYKIINDPNNTYKPDDETYTIGDYPDMPNADIIYNNGLSRADETYTTAWTIPGSIATYTFVEMLGRLGVNLMGAPRQQYNIRLMYMVPTLAIIIPDILEEGLYFIENGITYDNRMGAVEGTYIQMPEIYIDGFTVETAEEFDEKTGKPTTTNQKVTTGTQTPLNVDKKVSLIDIENVLVTPYGYFDADWFIHITDIDYGITRFRPYQADWTQDDPDKPDYIKNKPADTSGYTLPVATTTILGGVKQGANTTIAVDGTITFNGITGSGTVGYIPKFTSSTSIGDSPVYADGTNIGIGTNAPKGLLHISGALPKIYISETDQGSDKKLWRISSDSGNLYFSSRIDVDSGGSDWMTVNRGTGTAITSVAFPNGKIGIGQTTPTAYLHIKAGTATVNTAPLKLTSGTNLTTTEAGAIEYDGTHLYFTATNGGTRYQLDQQTAGYTLPVATTTILGGVKQGTGVTIDIDGTISVSAASGTVTTFSATGISGLFTTSVATETTTPALSFALVSKNANRVFASPNGASGVPIFRQIEIADINPNGSTPSASNFLCGDGTFKEPTGGTGTVTSVAMSVPTGFSISGTPITTSGTLAITMAAGYFIPTTTEQTNWNAAYNLRIATFTTTGSSGAATLTGNTLNIPNYTLAGLGGITLTSLSCTATGLTYTNTTGVLSLTSGYGIPTTAKQANWDDAYTYMGQVKLFGTTTYGNLSPIYFEWNTNSIQIKRDGTPQLSSLLPVTSGGVYDALLLKQDVLTLTNTGTSGAATLVGATLNIPIYGGGTNYWTYASGLLRPVNNTDKVLIGGGSDMGGYIMQVTGLNKTIGQLSVDWQSGGSAYGLFANSNSNLAAAHFHNTASGDGAYALSDAATGLTAEGVFGLHAIGTTSALKVNLNTAPATATASGTTGEVRITAGYIYVCTATNTWVRAAITTF